MARYSLDSSALPHPAHYKPHYPINSRSEKNGLQSLLSELDRRRKTNITAKSSSSSAPFVSALKNKSSNSKDSTSGHNDDNTRTREAGINYNAFNPWRAASKSCTARPPLSAFRLPPTHAIPEPKLVKPNPVDLKPPATPSHYAPSKLARSKMAARPSLEDEAALFKQIESRHMSKINHGSALPTTTTRTKLWSEPGATSLELSAYRSSPQNPRPPSQKHIQDATQRSWELLQKKNAKRQLDQKRVEPSNKRVKFGEPDSKTAADNAPPPTKSHVQKVLPLESTRTITQYTVFETRRLALPFDGQLRDKVLRRESFLDKHKANRFAARLMPKAEYVQSTAAITRIEFDYGMGDAERDGMFLGRVYYNRDKKEEIKFVYVDRELQQLGKMSVADLEKEVSNRDLSAEYVQAFLAVRFDVFVVLRKAIQHDDGRMVVYAYDETEAEIHTREDVDSGDEEEEEEAEPRQEKEVQTESEDDQITLGSHFEHLLQGSYTTQSEANTMALDAFEEWTRPPSDRPRLDAVIYHRDYIKPDIAQRRIAANVDGSLNAENIAASKLDVESIELSWEPPPQFGYSYSSISVVVTKSQMQGPLDLTGAFKTG
ncbi:hypothetical protein F503_03805 [Ophiostoma piceae UAMH 11346]|uniref:Uncharacterized protein n=1 Tax=Ophiostoma piceae (strain UAMH 11346) TaxID=1262450 RepID=S3CWP3_OPHP1|nr:hypothetical protein F503_03805 [Ophiostoma piceae UAMH 11346]